MSDVVISVENISKQYRIGTITHRTLQRDLQAWWARLRGKEDPNLPVDGGRYKRLEQCADENGIIHALRDVSFEVRQGEVLGIIGKNGAGKSTLLKILSRVTAPTSGCVKIKGRVGSLLEVGTGFHPELTGRENIYMNGAILGMKKKEIDRKLDEIIDFSGVEQFIDTPVKRYSSGMYVRLAFAVAAHLDPEILLVDEVLAVGDAEFQKKCLGKMDDVSKKEGRTVLFVSHNMAAIKHLCRRSILMNSGSITLSGETLSVVNAYLVGETKTSSAKVPLSNHPNRLPNMSKILKEISLLDRDGLCRNIFFQDEEVRIKVSYHCDKFLAGAGFTIYTQDDEKVGGGNTYMSFPPPYSIPSSGEVIFILSEKQFLPGRYYVTVSVGSHPSVLVDKIEKPIYFDIIQSDIYGTGYLLTKEEGVVVLRFHSLLNETSFPTTTG